MYGRNWLCATIRASAALRTVIGPQTICVSGQAGRLTRNQPPTLVIVNDPKKQPTNPQPVFL